MAVTTSHRKEPTEMNVITKAKDVFKHSRQMIKTDKHFPKKERFMMVKDIYLTETGKTVWKLRRRSKNNMSRKLKKFRKLLDNGQITMESVHQSYQSWKGHALRGNCYHLVKQMDELYNNLFKEDNKNVSITVKPTDRGESQVR